jgi:hypothetical protein
LRHAITTGGGLLAVEGIADPETLQTIAGGAIAAAGLAWSIIEKRGRRF